MDVTAIQWTPRRFALATGLALWLGATFVQTGTGGIVALWTALVLLTGLTLVTTATRTVTLMDIVTAFCLGGAMLAPAVLAGAFFDASFGTGFTPARELGIPLVEETLKLAPVLWLIWRGRNAQTWTMGISDIVLLAMASGAGFGFVEDAFVRHAKGWGDSLAWLPTSEITGDRHGMYLTNGHGPMTAVAGVALGFALLFRRPRPQMIALTTAGFFWSVIDHARNNYSHHFHDGLTATLNFITGNSFLTAYLLLLGVVAAVAVDAYFAYAALPPLAETRWPPFPTSWEGVKALDRFLRIRNQLAYAVARYHREEEIDKARAATIAASIDAALYRCRFS